MAYDVPFGLALPVTRETARHDATCGRVIGAVDERV
jgi:hypothetical protein